jgi:hypothetical protein
MDINFDRKYAYAEVYDILNWLGDEYKKKVPRNLLRLFKEERKFGYDTNLDFTKPLAPQVRQETKNIIAYLETRCFLTDKAEIQKIEDEAKRRYEEEKARKRAERRRRNPSGSSVPLTAALDKALNNLKN